VLPIFTWADVGPIQWKVEDGGNGHFYQRVDGRITIDAAISKAEEMGGKIAFQAESYPYTIEPGTLLWFREETMEANKGIVWLLNNLSAFDYWVGTTKPDWFCKYQHYYSATNEVEGSCGFYFSFPSGAYSEASGFIIEYDSNPDTSDDGPPCDSSNLDLCTSPSDCASAGGKWVAEACITRPAIIRTTSAHTCDGVHHVFARGVDNHLLEWWWTWNDGWNISDLTAISWGKEISDVPSSFTADGAHHVFACGVDGHLYEWWWTWNDGWNISVLMENLCQKDNDGDGYSVNQGDCNDNDPTIHPNATEICGDGIDQDCWGGVIPFVLIVTYTFIPMICSDLSAIPV
jgi:hypothetical protein